MWNLQLFKLWQLNPGFQKQPERQADPTAGGPSHSPRPPSPHCCIQETQAQGRQVTLPRVSLTRDTSGQPGDTQNLARPDPASAPTLALVPTVKGTLWEQKATHCVTLRQRGRGQRLRTPGLVTTAPHATHSLGQREALGWGWGGTLEFPGRTLSFRKPWSHRAPAGQRS